MIYLDYAATTPLCDAAVKAIINNIDNYGNPSSVHSHGHEMKMMIEDARARIAKCINAEPEEIYFTSGGSEADTWALNGRVSLASEIEHHAVRPTFTFTVNNSGIVDIEDINFELKQHMLYDIPIEIVSCMMVNNEIGTIQPVKKIAELAHENNALFHTDAVQAVGHIPVDVKEIGCDMLSASAHKFGGPKGIGFLYVKKGVLIKPIIDGGKQEFGLRGGTENTLGILAMAAALEDSIEYMDTCAGYVGTIRDRLLKTLLEIDGVYINGQYKNRMLNNINVRIEGISGQDFVAMADEFNICCSTGSACNEGIATPSHVLKAIGLTDEEAISSVRFSLGFENEEDDIDYCCVMIPKIINRLREIS